MSGADVTSPVWRRLEAGLLSQAHLWGKQSAVISQTRSVTSDCMRSLSEAGLCALETLTEDVTFLQ